MNHTDEIYKEGDSRGKMKDHSLEILYLKKGIYEIEVADQVFELCENDLCLVPPDVRFSVFGLAGGLITK
ncbi:MAG: hypothetical protein LUH00_10050 [Lachnospiraceae bacterium]|nr:hypothetical protein [Lachnospiraceae bacterium]